MKPLNESSSKVPLAVLWPWEKDNSALTKRFPCVNSKIALKIIIIVQLSSQIKEINTMRVMIIIIDIPWHHRAMKWVNFTVNAPSWEEEKNLFASKQAWKVNGEEIASLRTERISSWENFSFFYLVLVQETTCDCLFSSYLRSSLRSRPTVHVPRIYAN